MKIGFVLSTKQGKEPFYIFNSTKEYLKSKDIEADFIPVVYYNPRNIYHSSILNKKFNSVKMYEPTKEHARYITHLDEFILGKTVQDLIDLKSILLLLRNYDLNKDLLSDINIPNFKLSLIQTLNDIVYKLHNCDYVCFSVYSKNIFYDLYTASFLKRKNSKIKIIFGGPQINYSEKTVELLSNISIVDHIIKGDAETGIYDLLTKDISKVHNSDNLILSNLQIQTPTISSLFNYEASLISTRNCFNHCGYCPAGSLSFNIVPLNIIEKQIKVYNENKKIRIINFPECITNYSIKRFDSILDILIKYDTKKKYVLWCHPINFNKEIINKLKKLDFRYPGELVIGVETGSDALLTKLNRNHSEEIIKNIELIIKNLGFIHLTFISGIPIETDQDHYKTALTIKNLKKKYNDKISFSIFPYEMMPGSNFYNKNLDYNISFENFDTSLEKIYPSLKNIITNIPKNYICQLSISKYNKRLSELMDAIHE